MRIKLIQINLWWGGWLWESLIEFLRAENPDIIVAQEAYAGMQPDLKPNFRTATVLPELLGYPYSDFVPEFIHNRAEGRFEMGNLVLSKFPITSSASAFFVGTYGDWTDTGEKYAEIPRRLQHVALDLGAGMNLDLFNVHGVVDYRGEYDSPERLKMSQIIIDQIRGKEPVIVAGDFNLKPNTQTVRNIEQHLQSVFKNDLASTFNMRRKENPGYATAAVDMIFLSKNIKVLERNCPDVDISDHFPLVAVLEL